MSLLLNAAQSIQVSRTIRIRTLAEDGRIHAQIVDTGKGIAAERPEHLFDFSFSSDEAAVKLGPGLSTSCSILQQHNGEVRADSVLGEGGILTISAVMELFALNRKLRCHQKGPPEKIGHMNHSPGDA